MDDLEQKYCTAAAPLAYLKFIQNIGTFFSVADIFFSEVTHLRNLPRENTIGLSLYVMKERDLF